MLSCRFLFCLADFQDIFCKIFVISKVQRLIDRTNYGLMLFKPPAFLTNWRLMFEEQAYSASTQESILEEELKKEIINFKVLVFLVLSSALNCNLIRRRCSYASWF